MSRSVRTPVRALVAWFAVPQIIWLTTAFWHQVAYSPATLAQSANAPLPLPPGPMWLVAVSFLSFLVSLACPILMLVLVGRDASRIRRLVPARSPWRAAWIAISVAALATDADAWAGGAAWFSGWHWPLNAWSCYR